MSGPAVFERTVHRTHEWLRDIEEALGLENHRSAHAALRATLHALRDHLATDEVAQLGAQLPTLLRGIYYEGWDPRHDRPSSRAAHDFLESVRRETKDHPELMPIERTVEAVFAVLSNRISSGEIRQVIQQLPKSVREMWTDGPA